MDKLWVPVNYVIRGGKKVEKWRMPWPVTRLEAERVCKKSKEKDVYDGYRDTIWVAEQVQEL